MITVVKHYGGNRVDMHGLSTDTKPKENIGNASGFLEMDTGDYFKFDEENNTWHKL